MTISISAHDISYSSCDAAVWCPPEAASSLYCVVCRQPLKCKSQPNIGPDKSGSVTNNTMPGIVQDNRRMVIPKVGKGSGILDEHGVSYSVTAVIVILGRVTLSEYDNASDNCHMVGG